MAQILGATDSYSRGQTCQQFNLGVGASSSHCLRFDPLWFSAYEIDVPQLTYQINVVTSNDINQTLNTLTISPSNPLQVNQDIKMVAKIVGDLPGVKPPPDLSNKILLIPSAPADHPWVTGGMG